MCRLLACVVLLAFLSASSGCRTSELAVAPAADQPWYAEKPDPSKTPIRTHGGPY